MCVRWAEGELVMCAISSVGEAGREGTCGGGRLLAGLVHN